MSSQPPPDSPVTGTERADQVPRGLVVLKAGATAEGPADDLVKMVLDEIGAVACFKQVEDSPRSSQRRRTR